MLDPDGSHRGFLSPVEHPGERCGAEGDGPLPRQASPCAEVTCWALPDPSRVSLKETKLFHVFGLRFDKQYIFAVPKRVPV